MLSLVKYLLRWFAVLAVVVFGVWAVQVFNRGTLLPKVQLTLTAGSGAGLRNTIAEHLAVVADGNAIALEVVPTSGSRASLEKVESGEINLALIQGGLSLDEYPNIRQVAALYVEPLHLLVRGPLVPAVAAHLKEGLAPDAAGKRRLINVSTQGSGTHDLAMAILAYVGLKPEVDFEPTYSSYEELLDPKRPDEWMPDAVFTVSSLPSPVARYLIEKRGYGLIPLPLTEAFRLEGRNNHADKVRRMLHVETTIPPFTYNCDPATPATPLVTIGTRLLVIANRGVASAAIERLVETIYDTPFANFASPALEADLLVRHVELPLHDGAKRYLRRNAPLIAGDVIEFTEQSLAILGAIIGGSLFLWQAAASLRRRRRDRIFLDYLRRVAEMEQRALNYENDPHMTVEDLIMIQQGLAVIKTEALTQFNASGLDGAELLSSFLRHVNDASELVTRMILHERAPRS